MKSYTTNEVRKRFKDFLLETYAKDEVVYVLHYNKPMAALVPIKYAEIIEEIIRREKNGK
jgi:PHD/YefM family antitoxin component YafN of YafNO toxin-antitoxin module